MTYRTGYLLLIGSLVLAAMLIVVTVILILGPGGETVRTQAFYVFTYW